MGTELRGLAGCDLFEKTKQKTTLTLQAKQKTYAKPTATTKND
jgi:hypothetical protein